MMPFANHTEKSEIKLELENTGPHEASAASHPLVSTLQLPEEAWCLCACVCGVGWGGGGGGERRGCVLEAVSTLGHF